LRQEEGKTRGENSFYGWTVQNEKVDPVKLCTRERGGTLRLPGKKGKKNKQIIPSHKQQRLGGPRRGGEKSQNALVSIRVNETTPKNGCPIHRSFRKSGETVRGKARKKGVGADLNLGGAKERICVKRKKKVEPEAGQLLQTEKKKKKKKSATG